MTFEPRRNLVHQFQREVRDFVQDADHADADDEAVFPRLNMHIAGIGHHSVLNDVVDDAGDIDFFEREDALEILGGCVQGEEK
jgi:hypothetical protein